MSRSPLAVLSLVLTLFVGVAQAAQDKDILSRKAPDFTLPSVPDGTLRLSSLKGKVVVLDFWAVWCGPCTDSMPFFQKLQDTYGKEGLEVVGLHVEDRIPPIAEIKDFLKEIGVHYRNVLSTTEVDDSYRVYAMPTTYIVDREGILRKRHVGFNPKTAPERIEKDVKALLSR